MQRKKQLNINDLSDHIFWDVDHNNLDINKNFAFILQRVLGYGLLHDWNLIYKSFGLKRITEEAKKIRYLDDRSLHFIAHLSDSNLNDFRCYITKQSIPGHWNF